MIGNGPIKPTSIVHKPKVRATTIKVIIDYKKSYTIYFCNSKDDSVVTSVFIGQENAKFLNCAAIGFGNKAKIIDIQSGNYNMWPQQLITNKKKHKVFA